MFSLLAAWLGLLSLSSALPTTSLEVRDDNDSTPRSIVYVQTFHYMNNTNISLIPIFEQHTRATHVYLASVHVNDGPGNIALNDNDIDSSYWDDIWSEAAQLQQDGIKVGLLLGGAARGSYTRLCSGDSSNGTDGVILNEDYYTPLRDTLRLHKVDGLDLDIEEQVNMTCPLALLQRLNQDMGPEFILTMAPLASDMDARQRGLGGFNYKKLDAAATAPDKAQLVNWYNTQFYNGWGSAASPNEYNNIIAQGWTPDRIVMGVLDNKADGGSGWYNISTYQKTISTLMANYNNFGGVVGWEYWDAGVSDGIDNPPEWISDISDVLFGAATSYKQDYTAEPIPEGGSPWPALTSTLQGLNVSYIDSVLALNMTNGNLEGALKWLGLGDLVSDVVGDLGLGNLPLE